MSTATREGDPTKVTASTRQSVVPGAPQAPAAAAVLSRARGENFSVASRVLPAPAREGLMAIYGFARLVDDIGDEAPGDRLALLDWAERELDSVYEGEPAHPLMRRLQPVVRRTWSQAPTEP